MTHEYVLSLKTDVRVLDALQRATTVKLTQADLLEQRISFVYGAMGGESTMTKEQVRKVILQQAGIIEQ